MAERERSSARTALAESSYQRGVRSFQEGRFEEAARALAESLQEQETSESWNDWAAAELAAGQSKAEKGFKRALALDASNSEALANLGAFLARAGRHSEAIPYLESAMGVIAEPQRAAVKQLLNTCRGAAARPNSLDNSSDIFLKQLGEVQERFPTALGGFAARPPFDGSDHDVVALKKEFSTINWFHQIDLRHGVITPGCHSSHEELQTLQLPARLDGCTVLDIRAWDGFFRSRPSGAAPHVWWPQTDLFGEAGVRGRPTRAGPGAMGAQL